MRHYVSQRWLFWVLFLGLWACFSSHKNHEKTGQRQTVSGNRQDPLVNFDYLWRIFEERYAFFDLRNVNWNESKKKYRPLLSRDSSPEALCGVLRDMLAEFHDDHVTLTPPEPIYSTCFPEDDGVDSDDIAEKVADLYLANAKERMAGKIRWGELRSSRGSSRLGYLQLNTMEFHLDDVTASSFCPPDVNEETCDEEVLFIRQQMMTILQDLSSAEAMILDLRFNGGGYETVAFEILRHFNKTPQLVYVKHFRAEGSQRWQTKNIILPASTAPYPKPLYILTSPMTASASESLVMASFVLPAARRIGDTTCGIFSDMYEGVLPNGWTFTLSDEIYVTPTGEGFEGRGIPPHKRVVYSQKPSERWLEGLEQSLKKNVDPAIETVLEEISTP